MTQEKDGKDATKNVAIMRKNKNIVETKEGREEEKMFV